MAPKPLNHNSADLKNGPNGFSISEYPNKSRITEYVKNSPSKNGKCKLAFSFQGLLGDIFSRILSRPWFLLKDIANI